MLRVIHRIELTSGNDKGSYRLGYTYFDDKGVLPNSKMKKHNINLSAGYELTDRLTSNVSINYINQGVVGRNSTGYSDNLMSQFRQWWQTNVDISRQEALFNETGRNVSWNMKSPANGDYSPIFWDNPYWTRYKNFQSDDRDRIFGNTSLNYKLTDWLSATARVSMDQFTQLREERRANGSVALNFGLQGNDETSGYQRQDISFREMNYDLMLNYNHRFSDDFNLSGVAGVNVRTEETDRVTQSTTGGLAVPELYAISNSVNTPPLPTEYLGQKQVNGYYASAS